MSKIFLGFLSLPYPLSLTSRNPLFFILPHRIHSFPANLVSGKVPSVKLELRRPSPVSGPALNTVGQLRKSHASYRSLHVRRCSGHAVFSSDFLLLQSSSWSSGEGGSTSEGLQELLHEDRDTKPSPSSSYTTITPRRSYQPPGVTLMSLEEAKSSFKSAQIALNLNG